MSFKVPKGINKVPFSIRVDEEDYKVIHKLSIQNKKSYNYIINSMIKYAIRQYGFRRYKKCEN